MNRLSRLLILMLALILAVPLVHPTAPSAQAQDGGQPSGAVPNGTPGGGDFWVPLTPLGADTAVESVIAPVDSRIRITNTTNPNYRWVVKLEMDFGGFLYICSGWLIGPRLVATAGHCVYNGRWASSIRVIPAQNAASEPYSYQYTSNYWTTADWFFSADPDYDIGAVVLPDATMGGAVGVWQNYGWFSNFFLWNDLKSQVNVTGYPGDKLVSGQTGWTMWTDKDPLVDTSPKMVHYTVDTYGGQSGSAVWTNYKGKKFAIGTHAYGVGSSSPCAVYPSYGVSNCGPRIDDTWLDLMSYPCLVDGACPAGQYYTDIIPPPAIYSPTVSLLTNQKVLFSWDTHPQAVMYELWIDKWDLSGYWKGTIHKKTASTTWLANLGSGYYEWWIRIIQANQFPGEWGYSGWFQVDKKKPAKPVLIWPPHNSIVSSSLVFEWSPLPDLDVLAYWIQVNNINGGWASPVAQTFTSGTAIVGGFPAGVWYWRVSAVDMAGNFGPWSKVGKFAVVGPSATISIDGQTGSLEGGMVAPAPRTTMSGPPPMISIGDDPTKPPRDNYRGTGGPAPVSSVDEAGAPTISIEDGSVPVIPID